MEKDNIKIVGRLYREMLDSERAQIVDLLSYAVYRSSHDDQLSIIASLSLWLAEANIKPTSSLLLTRELEEHVKKIGEGAAGISLPDRKKIYGILASAYRWAGADLSPYAGDIEKIAGIRLDELEDISAIDIHRKRSLRDVLQSLYGEEKTFYIIHELVSQLKYLPSILDLIVVESPVEDSIYYAIDLRDEMITKVVKMEDLNLMLKADRRRLISALVPRKIRLYYGRKDQFLKFLLGAPYVPSLDALDKIEIVLTNKSIDLVRKVGPLPLKEALAEAANHKLVFGKRTMEVAIRALIDYGLKYGWNGLEVVPAPEDNFSGIYLLGGHNIAVSGFEIREPDIEKLRVALEQLNELISFIVPVFRNKATTAIKWAAVAPFSLIRRRFFGLPFRWLYIKGYKRHRKFFHKLILTMWGLDEERHVRRWHRRNSPTTIMKDHSLSTFPHIFIDKGHAIKNAKAKSFIERSVSKVPSSPSKSVFEPDLVAVAPFVISTDRRLLPNPELAENFVILNFYEGIVHTKGGPSRDIMSLPILDLMREIGNCVAWQAIKNPELLAKETELHAGLALLEACYSMAGVDMHKSFRSEYKLAIDENYVKNLIRYYIRRTIYLRYVRAMKGTKRELADRLKELLEKDILRRYGIYQLDNDRVAVTKAFLRDYLFSGISLEMVAKALDGNIEQLDSGEQAVVVTIDRMVNALKKIARGKGGEST